jgi:proline iminopeptidase
MSETPFEIAIGGGTVYGHFGGTGIPALLLHGGPGLPDYMEGCAAELANLFTTIRYTQRGTLPSTVGGPYTVETHMADALAILDLFGQEKAWAVGHSWGGHLALHLAVAHPHRLYGIVCIDPLGASAKELPAYREALLARLGPEERTRVEEIEEHSDAGEVAEEEALEQSRILWPVKFADRETAPPHPFEHIGVECNADTIASIMEHFDKRTLRKGLPAVAMPALFAHGIQDPLPIRASLATAKLIPGARVARIPSCGHFPWLERPGFLNRSLRGLIATL